MASKLPVLVVGAGPSGLAMALCLARNKVPVRIIDSGHEFHRGTRGAGLQPRSLEIFKMLGMLEDVNSQRGVINPPAQFYKYPETTEVAMTDANPLLPPLEPTPDRPLNSMWFVPQNRLESLFRKELDKLGVGVELGHALETFEDTGDKIVAHIKVKADAGEKTETVEASYIVGADGARGPVRKVMQLNFLGKTMDADGMLVGNMVVNNLATNVSHVWKLPNGLFFSLRPISHETKQFSMAVLGPGAILEGKDSPEGMKTLFAEYTHRSDVIFGDFHWYSFFKPNMRVVDKFSVGRAFVSGDAAHIHSPHGGQGLNTSVQDSVNLAWKMALVWHGLSSPKLLETYNEERLPVVAEMLRKVIGLYNVFQEDANKALSAAAHPVELFQLDINYRWSPICLEERNPLSVSIDELKAHAYKGWDTNLCAGDRAPDAPELDIAGTSGKSTLFEVFSPTLHTILIFGDIALFSNLESTIKSKSLVDYIQVYVITKDVSATSGVPSTVTTIHDRAGHAFSAYQAKAENPLCITVRPDGYIGCVVTSEVGVEKYLSLIFST